METVAKTLTKNQLLRAMLRVKDAIRVATRESKRNPATRFNIFNSYQNINILLTEYKNRQS